VQQLDMKLEGAMEVISIQIFLVFKLVESRK